MLDLFINKAINASISFSLTLLTMRKYISIGLATAVLALMFLRYAFAASHMTNINAVDSNGTIQDIFQVSDDVYVEGTCNKLDQNQMVEIYIVPDQTVWSGGDPFLDVRGASTPVQADMMANLPRTLV